MIKPQAHGAHRVHPVRPRPRRAVSYLALAAVLVISLLVLGGIGANGAQAATTHVVDAVDDAGGNYFTPQELTIQPGDTVEWQFDQATMGHTVSSQGSNWNLNEYRNPNGAPVRYTFTQPGEYRYFCSLHGGMTGTITVAEAPANRAPTADPMVEPRQGNAPLYVHFEANASDPDGDALSYEWDFGTSDTDSDKSTSAHAHHDYTEPGNYTATLRVSDGKGGELRREFSISVGNPDGQSPVVTASANPTRGDAPLTVLFMGSATDPQGEQLTYEWDFGVPGTDEDKAASARASYTYEQPGSYDAVLTARDPQGNAGTKTVKVTVDGAGGPEPPEIEALAEPAYGESPLEVAFSTRLTTRGEFRAYADAPSLGYGEIPGTAEMVRERGRTEATIMLSGLKPNAGHQVHVHAEPCSSNNGGPHFRFDESKPYSEENELWLPFTSDANGNSGHVHEEKPLRAGPKAVSIVVHEPTNPAKRIACVDLAPDEADLSYSWEFGDGATATGPDPDHAYDEPGTYAARVTATEAGGATSTDTVEVTVEEPRDTTAPDTAITSGPDAATRNRSAVFAFGSSEPGARFACSLDGSPFAPCSSPRFYGGLSDGQHAFRVRAEDAAGNADASPAERRWTVDATRPTVTGERPKGSTRDRTPGIAATVRDSRTDLSKANVRLTVDGKAVKGFTYNRGTNRLSYTPKRGLDYGRHSVVVVARDAVGNVATERWAFRVVRR